MERPLAVELVGYLRAALGVGEAARRYVVALRSVGVEVLERDVPLPGRDPAGTVLPAGPSPPPDSISFNLVCLNPEQMTPYLDSSMAPDRVGRRTVGIWSWEVDVLPPGWREAAIGLDDVWTYSSFAAERISAGIGSAVHSIPPPVCEPMSTSELSVRLPDGFRVLVMFDYLSTLQRKNPLGAIEAFKRAFPPGDDAVLIVKSVNGQHRRERQAEIALAAEGRSDIVLLDQTMSGAERDALICACDCFLSLHRSEGHGLPLAEAMALRKPVVATAYGGNAEFMNEGNSFPVAWSQVHVGEGVEHYPAGALWAEPDVEHATRLLRAVRDEPKRAGRRAAQGHVDVLKKLAPEVVGAQMVTRLGCLDAGRFPTSAGFVTRLASRLVSRR
jgi:glycosyltransferase involved in cell wall biosynthesis